MSASPEDVNLVADASTAPTAARMTMMAENAVLLMTIPFLVVRIIFQR
jgi:hypothetical protein